MKELLKSYVTRGTPFLFSGSESGSVTSVLVLLAIRQKRNLFCKEKEEGSNLELLLSSKRRVAAVVE